MSTGLFIVFEGIDGSGSTTQCRLLARRLEEAGLDAVHTREPGGTVLAERIRALVLDPAAGPVHALAELFLYAASRAQHVEELVRPALRAGKIVLCDRFVDSTLAYQGYGRGLDLGMVRRVNGFAAGDCRPDLPIFLDLPVAVALERRRQRGLPADRLESEGDSLQEKVAGGYREIAREHGHGALVLDATLDAETLSEQVWATLEKRWPETFSTREKGRS